EELLGERALEVGDGSVDQLRAIVGGHYFHARWQARLDFRQLRLDALDHTQGVLAITHDRHAADHIAGTVEIGDTATHVGPELDAPDVTNQDRRAAALVAADNDLLEILHGAGIAAPAHHVFTAVQLDEPPANVVVALADC